MSSDKRFMTRGLGQVLFNYLPDATFDYDRGSCICKVAEVHIDTDIEEKIDKRRILEEIREYIRPWGEHSTLKIADTFNPKLFAFGTPQGVLFNVYPLTFECRKCRSAFSYPDPKQFLSKSGNRTCRFCGGRLIQIYHVLVHHCGNIKALWVPTCPNHGVSPSRVVLDFRESQTARDFRWVCKDCNTELRPINRTCEFCKQEPGAEEKGEEPASRRSTMMRAIPHRANAAYYSHHITKVNVGTEDVRSLLTHPDRARILVESYLRDSYTTSELLEGVDVGKDPQESMAQQVRQMASGLPDGPERKKLLDAAEAMERLAAGRKESPGDSTKYGLSDETFNELFEYVKLRGTRKFRGLDEVREEAERRRPGCGASFDYVSDLYRGAGIKEIRLIENFPILTAVFGYTRVSFEPESRMGDEVLKTRFNKFQALRGEKKSLNDKTPVFVRAAETEAIFLRIAPLRLLQWLESMFPGKVDPFPSTEQDARLWMLVNVGGVDRFVTREGMNETTKAVFGLIHTMSHMFIRTASSLAGIDRTGLAEYLFPRIGAAVIYNSNTMFNLGGLTTLYEEELLALIEKTKLDPFTRQCVYDPVCREQWNSSCHACMHLGEMACSYFNRGMSREYLFGPKGFWTP